MFDSRFGLYIGDVKNLSPKDGFKIMEGSKIRYHQTRYVNFRGKTASHATLELELDQENGADTTRGSRIQVFGSGGTDGAFASASGPATDSETEAEPNTARSDPFWNWIRCSDLDLDPRKTLRRT